MLKRLRLKFVCINMIIVTIMLVVIFSTILHFTSQNLEQDSLSMMRNIAMNSIFPGRPNVPTEELRLPFFVLQIGPGGTLLSARGGYYDLSDEAFLQELIHLAFAVPEQSGVLSEYSLRFCRIAAPNSQLLVFADISSELRTMESLFRNCLLIGLLSFLLFLVVSLILARWAIRPVEEAWEQQRQFVADASHELKTPLTVITTNAELLHSPEYDPEQKVQFSHNILTMSQQMRHLLEGLLNLAKTDSPASPPETSPLNFSKLPSDTLLPFEPVFFEKGLLFHNELEEGLYLRGDPALLRQTVEILLDNAQKYAHPHSTVTLRLWRHKRTCRLSVQNQGDPISKEDLKQIFQRFYRVDKARTRSGSYGLGLSIAENIVRQHRGKIWAESENGLNTFHIQLPLSL